MSTTTTVLSLTKNVDADSSRTALKTDIPANMDILDALFHATTGHLHTGATTNGPQLTGAALSANAILTAQALTIVAKAFADSPYTISAWGVHLDVDATAGAVTVNLPTAAGNLGRHIEVRKTDSSANTVTVDAAGTEEINGATTQVLYSQYDSYTFRALTATTIGIV